MNADISELGNQAAVDAPTNSGENDRALRVRAIEAVVEKYLK